MTFINLLDKRLRRVVTRLLVTGSFHRFIIRARRETQRGFESPAGDIGGNDDVAPFYAESNRPASRVSDSYRNA